jgi:ABC-2 type transport system permease protein
VKAIWLITRRELSGYFSTMTGYVIMAVVLGVNALWFNTSVLGGSEKRSAEVLADFFNATSGIGIICAAVFISMRLLAEERQAGTLPLLYSSPVRDSEIIAGKFLSALIFLGIMTALSIFMPLLIAVNGKISLGHIVAGYLGLMLLGSACLAIGTLGSALARNQVLAAIIGGCLLAAMIMMWFLATVTERPLSEVFSGMALWNQHFPSFKAGLVHTRDIVYYLVVTYVALFAATRVLEARRWR